MQLYIEGSVQSCCIPITHEPDIWYLCIDTHYMTWEAIKLHYLHPITLNNINQHHPDSKVHGAFMGPTRVMSAPGGPHGGPMNLQDFKYVSTYITQWNVCNMAHQIWVGLLAFHELIHLNGPIPCEKLTLKYEVFDGIKEGFFHGI